MFPTWLNAIKPNTQFHLGDRIKEVKVEQTQYRPAQDLKVPGK
jgi:hypothetical protein